MKQSRYMTRAMKSRDPRFQRILGKLGHVPAPATDNEIIHGPRASQVETVEVEVADNVETAAVPDPVPEAEPESDPTVEEVAEKPAKAENPVRRKPSAKLDHDDSGKAGSSRKKAAKEGRYKRRDMKAED